MTKKSKSTGNPLVGCLLSFTLFIAMFIGGCRTELGWTYTSSLGGLNSDVEQTLSTLGLTGMTIEKARLKVGSRQGYALLKADKSSAEAGLKKLEELKYTPLFTEEEREDQEYFLTSVGFKVGGRGVPEHLKEGVTTALLEGSCQGVSGVGAQGPVELTCFMYLPKEDRVLVIFHYRYG